MQSLVQWAPQSLSTRSLKTQKYLQGAVQVQLLSALQRLHQPAERNANKCFTTQQSQKCSFVKTPP